MRAHGDPDVTHLMLQSSVLPKKGFPVMFHGIKGTEKRTRRSPSYFNILEASVVRNYCVALTEDPELRISKGGTTEFRRRFVYLRVDPEEIGVIAPYRAQVRTIRALLRQARLSEISVGSVEQFQGQVGVESHIYDGMDVTNSGLLCTGTKGDHHGDHPQ
jgi:helicase MOV-10